MAGSKFRPYDATVAGNSYRRKTAKQINRRSLLWDRNESNVKGGWGWR